MQKSRPQHGELREQSVDKSHDNRPGHHVPEKTKRYGKRHRQLPDEIYGKEYRHGLKQVCHRPESVPFDIVILYQHEGDDPERKSHPVIRRGGSEAQKSRQVAYQKEDKKHADIIAVPPGVAAHSFSDKTVQGLHDHLGHILKPFRVIGVFKPQAHYDGEYDKSEADDKKTHVCRRKVNLISEHVKLRYAVYHKIGVCRKYSHRAL